MNLFLSSSFPKPKTAKGIKRTVKERLNSIFFNNLKVKIPYVKKASKLKEKINKNNLVFPLTDLKAPKIKDIANGKERYLAITLTQ